MSTAQAVTAQAVITITLLDNGQVHINAPLQNKVLCYGLLAMAGDLVRAYDPQAAPLVVPASALPRNGMGAPVRKD